MTWRPQLGLGLAALSTTLRGNANPSWISHQRTVYTVAPRVSLDLGWALHSRLRLGVGLSYLMPLRGQRLVVADREVASYGDHIFVASLGLDLAL